MRKEYCPPVTESICVKTYVIAASTDVLRSPSKADAAVKETPSSSSSSSWGSLWG